MDKAINISGSRLQPVYDIMKKTDRPNLVVREIPGAAKNNPIRKIKFLEKDETYFAVFFTIFILISMYISVRCINFIKILHPHTK